MTAPRAITVRRNIQEIAESHGMTGIATGKVFEFKYHRIKHYSGPEDNITV